MRSHVAALIALALLPVGCRETNDEALTLGEASQALEEAQVSTEASNLIGSSIEITTSFTIGQAVQETVQEIGDFVTSQLPCAEVTLAGNTITIAYGAKPGNCTYQGQTYSGTHSVTVVRNDEGDIQVDHAWTDFQNQKLKVNGTANVTWSFDEGSRHVVHELDWTRLSDGKSWTGSGDRTQTVLDGGLAEGIRVDGERSWESEAGTWELDIDGVELRWIDPVPQAGSYALITPANKSLTLAFARLDSDTIHVTITGPKKSFEFDVTSAPAE